MNQHKLIKITNPITFFLLAPDLAILPDNSIFDFCILAHGATHHNVDPKIIMRVSAIKVIMQNQLN